MAPKWDPENTVNYTLTPPGPPLGPQGSPRGPQEGPCTHIWYRFGDIVEDLWTFVLMMFGAEMDSKTTDSQGHLQQIRYPVRVFSELIVSCLWVLVLGTG